MGVRLSDTTPETRMAAPMVTANSCSKRPMMAQAAAAGSDLLVLTSDNPRSEDPMAIINEARVGLEQTRARFTVEPDRAKAIRIAVSEAQPGDIVLIAGKGHEKYQITREGTFPFDDVEVARSALFEIRLDCKSHSRLENSSPKRRDSRTGRSRSRSDRL